MKSTKKKQKKNVEKDTKILLVRDSGTIHLIDGNKIELVPYDEVNINYSDGIITIDSEMEFKFITVELHNVLYLELE